MGKSLWVVIPCYNEEGKVAGVIAKTKPYASNVVVVDDGSRDNTYDTAIRAGAVVLRHVANLGLGDGLKTGCDYAVLKGADYIITLDGDGQHDPAEIPKLVRCLDDGYDIAFGVRHYNERMPFLKKAGNLIIYLASWALFGITVRDTQTGFRAFTRDAYSKVRWDSQGYSVASEVVVNAKLRRIRFKEVPVSTIYHNKFKGTGVFDGVRIVHDLVMWRLRSWTGFK